MRSLAPNYYPIGTKVWYRRGAEPTHELRGVVEDITVGTPRVSYCVRLDSRERVWVACPELRPR